MPCHIHHSSELIIADVAAGWSRLSRVERDGRRVEVRLVNGSGDGVDRLLRHRGRNDPLGTVHTADPDGAGREVRIGTFAVNVVTHVCIRVQISDV